MTTINQFVELYFQQLNNDDFDLDEFINSFNFTDDFKFLIKQILLSFSNESQIEEMSRKIEEKITKEDKPNVIIKVITISLFMKEYEDLKKEKGFKLEDFLKQYNLNSNINLNNLGGLKNIKVEKKLTISKFVKEYFEFLKNKDINEKDIEDFIKGYKFDEKLIKEITEVLVSFKDINNIKITKNLITKRLNNINLALKSKGKTISLINLARNKNKHLKYIKYKINKKDYSIKSFEMDSILKKFKNEGISSKGLDYIKKSIKTNLELGIKNNLAITSVINKIENNINNIMKYEIVNNGKIYKNEKAVWFPSKSRRDRRRDSHKVYYGKLMYVKDILTKQIAPNCKCSFKIIKE